MSWTLWEKVICDDGLLWMDQKNVDYAYYCKDTTFENNLTAFGVVLSVTWFRDSAKMLGNGQFKLKAIQCHVCDDPLGKEGNGADLHEVILKICDGVKDMILNKLVTVKGLTVRSRDKGIWKFHQPNDVNINIVSWTPLKKLGRKHHYCPDLGNYLSSNHFKHIFMFNCHGQLKQYFTGYENIEPNPMCNDNMVIATVISLRLNNNLFGNTVRSGKAKTWGKGDIIFFQGANIQTPKADIYKGVSIRLDDIHDSDPDPEAKKMYVRSDAEDIVQGLNERLFFAGVVNITYFNTQEDIMMETDYSIDSYEFQKKIGSWYKEWSGYYHGFEAPVEIKFV